MKAYNAKIELKGLTIHDLEKVVAAFLDPDYWRPEQTIEIATLEAEEE